MVPHMLILTPQNYLAKVHVDAGVFEAILDFFARSNDSFVPVDIDVARLSKHNRALIPAFEAHVTQVYDHIILDVLFPLVWNLLFQLDDSDV